ncbi:YraN family protein [Treponema sp.]|uniref:YraN family protein n=1 Tax=Treponema sp. TaxID=166 RepID=UPI003EFFC6CF
MKISTHTKGAAGEDKAADFLAKNGYTILDRNFRNREGEIDIIAGKQDFIVFVEVKYLPLGTLEMLAQKVGRAKQKKIIKTSKCYLENHREYNNRFVRYDIIALDVPGLDPVYHIENAFSE